MQITCIPYWQRLEAAALKAWQESGERALIVVPSAMLRSWLLSRLAEELGGIRGDTVIALEPFAETLAQKNSRSLGRLARPLELRLAAWDAFQNCDLPPQWRVGGIVDAFLNAVEELELHGLEPDKVAALFPDDSTVAHLTKLWRRWRDALHRRNLWTVGDVLQEGIRAAKSLRDNLPSEIIVYGFTALTDLRWRFLQALHQNGADLKFFVPTFEGNEAAYRYTRDLLRLLQPCPVEPYAPQGGELPEELRAIVNFAFKWQPEALTSRPTDRILCIAAAGEEQEVEMVVRVLIKWRREKKLQRFGDALVLVRSTDKYLPALEAVSARHGVPFVLMEERGQPARGLQRLFNAVAELRLQGLNGGRLWQILPSPYLQVGGKPLLPPERQKEVLQTIRQNIVESDIERWAQRFETDGQFARQLKEFLTAVNRLPMEARADEHAKGWRDLLAKFIAPTSEGEAEAIRQVRDVLNNLADWSTNLRLEEVVSLLVGACWLPVQNLKDAVRVVSVSEGRGFWSPVVALLGLNDGEFPQTPPHFELLTDEHRRKLGQHLKLQMPLKMRSLLLSAERMLFMEAVGAATDQLVLAYRRTDAEGKPQAASVFLGAVENALRASGWLWSKEERDLGDVLPRKLDEAIDGREAERAAIFNAFTGAEISEREKSVVSRLFRDPDFRLRLRREWLRWSKPQRGEWDGKLPSLSSPVVARLRTSGLRLTALEDYGHCPFKFFARHILNLRRPQDIAYTVDHRTFGVLWHEIMAEFLREWRRRGDLPDAQTLCAIAERMVRDRLANYPEMVRELVRQKIAAVTPQVWEAERGERAKGWKPVGSEVPLQIPAAKLGAVPEALKPVCIAIKIDRIDENDYGQKRVADYKTGSAPKFSDIEKGVALQLPIYALALGEQVAEASFLRLLGFSPNGYGVSCHLVSRVTHRQQQRLLGEMQQKAVNWTLRFLGGIAKSDFTVLPLDFNTSCRRCDFKALCRHSKLRLTERKQQAGGKACLE